MTTIDRAAAAYTCIIRGQPPVLLICSATSETLSKCSQELVRVLRRTGVRTEFHTPGGPERLLQATNRLLAEVPLDASLTNAVAAPPHVLVVDEAETLAEPETAALRRLVQGLRGGCFRVVLLVRRPRSSLQGMPLAEIADLTMVWDADAPETIDPTTEEMSPVEAVMPTPVSAPTAVIPDVLAELARERAAARGFDVTSSQRRRMAPVLIAIAVIGCLVAGIVLNDVSSGPVRSGPVAYDCGLHADRDSVDVLLSRIDRETPTRVSAESGRLRLQVGPFTAESAADAARLQVWQLGACRIEPTAYRDSDESVQEFGG